MAGKNSDVADGGVEVYVPLSFAIDDETPTVRTSKQAHWWAMLSASGYMDRTDPAGPFDTERAAAEYLVETFADDIYNCPDCEPEEE